MIVISKATVRYDGKPVLREVELTVPRGEFFGIIGPNGSGKSTLLNLISGVMRPDAGAVTVNGRDIYGRSAKERARFLAVLGQEVLPPVGFTVEDVIGMGRYPHQNWLGREKKDSAPLLRSIMDRLGLSGLEERTIDRLSGGERQRVALGKAMAQEPEVLLMDEPTTYLDIGYQLHMMDFVRDWNRENGLTVVAVLHDLNLAALYCDKLLVLKQGEVEAWGPPAQVLTEELIERVYGTRPAMVEHPLSGAPQLLLVPNGSGKGL